MYQDNYPIVPTKITLRDTTYIFGELKAESAEKEESLYAIFEKNEESKDIFGSSDNESFEIPIYSDDKVIDVMRKIEHLLKIPVNYQLIYNTGRILTHAISNFVIHIPSSFKKGVSMIDRNIIDYRYKLISAVLNKPQKEWNITVIPISDFLDQFNRQMLNSYDRFELTGFYETHIVPFYPNLSFNEFMKVLANETSPARQYAFDRSTDKLREITDTSALIVSEPTKLSHSYMYYIKDPIDCELLFNQFVTDSNYPFIQFHNIGSQKNNIKYDPSSITEEEIRKTIKTEFDSNTIYIHPKVRINESFINSKDTKIIERIGMRNNILYRESIKKYYMKITLPFVIDHNRLLNKLLMYPFIKRDYKNYQIHKKISFYFERVSFYPWENKTSSFSIFPTGSLVEISGTNVLDITINKISSDADLNSIVSFLVRFLTDMKNISSGDYGLPQDEIKMAVGAHSNVTSLDKDLFSRPVNGKIYSRICQKKNKPIAFIKDSQVSEDYLRRHSNLHYLEYPNMTHPNLTTVYICPTKEYPFPAFIKGDTYPCRPCCFKKPKNDAYFNYCMGNTQDISSNANLNNVYYIRQFRNAPLKQHGYSKLPPILNDLLNGKKCKIKNNILASGHTCYFLHNWVNREDSDVIKVRLRYEEPGRLKLINKWDPMNILDTLETQSAVYTLSYESYEWAIIKLSNKDKKITTTQIHSPTDVITKIFVKVLTKLIDESGVETGPTINNAISKFGKEAIRQVVRPDSNVIYKITINNIAIPIVPSFKRTDIKSVESASISFPDRDALVRIVTRLGFSVAGDISHYKQYYSGIILNSGYHIPHKKEKTSLTDNIKVTHPTRSSDPITYPDTFRVYLETYNVFLLHVAHALAEKSESRMAKIRKTKRDDRIEILTKYYKKLIESSHDDAEMEVIFREEWTSDNNAVLHNNIDNLEYYKKWRGNLREILISPLSGSKKQNAIRDLLDKILKVYVQPVKNKDVSMRTITRINIRNICSKGTSHYSLEDQCKGNKLVIGTATYKQFLDLVSYELVTNQFKRHKIINGYIPILVSHDSFSLMDHEKLLTIESK